MPFRTRKSTKGKTTVYKVVSSSGKVHGVHKTKKAAVRQVIAGNIAQGFVPNIKPRKKRRK